MDTKNCWELLDCINILILQMMKEFFGNQRENILLNLKSQNKL